MGTGVKGPERKADHSPSFSAEVKKGGAVRELPSYVFMTHCLTN
jgi:hypothetical protein